MDGGRVEHRDADIVLLDQQGYLGAAEDHTLGPFLARETLDDVHMLFLIAAPVASAICSTGIPTCTSIRSAVEFMVWRR